MLEDRSAATSDDRSAITASGRPLTRITDGLASEASPGTSVRRCPCCGSPIRAGQRITTIHGTSVHVRCSSSRMR
jgi:hypothetical protein